jgi:hypothetical protein
LKYFDQQFADKRAQFSLKIYVADYKILRKSLRFIDENENAVKDRSQCREEKLISRSYNRVFAMEMRFLVEFASGFGFWRLGANNYRVAQALYSTYNAKRISMSGRRWNPFGMEGGSGVDVRRGTADDEYEGRARRSLKWKCH